MIVLQLPWPPVKLSPNARVHHMQLAKHKAAYRALCAAVTTEQRRKMPDVPAGPLTLLVEGCAPTKRVLDLDGILSRMKSGIDAVCQVLRFDDSRFASVTVRRLPSIGKPGFVTVTIQQQQSAQGGAK